MKNALLLFLLFPCFVSAQEKPLHASFPLKDGKIHYEKIVQTDSVSNLELFQRAKAWTLATFKSQKDALQSEDRDIAVLNYQTFLTVTFKDPVILGQQSYADWKYLGDFKIYFKDRKVLIVFENIRLDNLVKDQPAYNIETYKEDNDEYFKSKWKEKDHRERYYTEVEKNFNTANAKFNALLKHCEMALKTKSGG